MLGPVFRVELVSTARRGRYYLLRVLFALGLLAVLWVSYSGVKFFSSDPLTIAESAELAATFFYSFSWLTLLGVLLVVPAIAIGTISEERERRTIEYLFATDLSNGEIVLGKLAARLLVVAMLLLVAVPILAIFRLLGGIAAELVITTLAICASTALFVTSGAICLSVWSSRTRDAVFRVYLVVGAVVFLPFVVFASLVGGAFFNSWLLFEVLKPVLGWWMKLSPIWVLSETQGFFRGGFGTNLDITIVLEMIAWHLLFSLLFCGSAVWAVRRVHLREQSQPDAQQVPTRRTPWRWRPGIGDKPMLWKEVFARGAAIKLGALGRAALLLIVGAFVVGTIGMVATTMARSGGSGFEEGVAFVAMGSMFGTGLLLLLAVRAACLVTLEKERDCWDSLLTTPLAGRQVIGAKVLGNLYACRWLMFVLLGLWSMGIVMAPSYAVVIPINLATVLILSLFVTCVGLLFSLRMSTSLRAMSATLATVFVVGGGYLFCCCMLAIVGVGGEEFILVACVPFLLAAPSVVHMMMQENGGEVAWVVGIYAFGMFLYLIATALCYAVAENRFDELAGRIWLTKSPPPEDQVAEQDAPSAS